MECSVTDEWMKSTSVEKKSISWFSDHSSTEWWEIVVNNKNKEKETSFFFLTCPRQLIPSVWTPMTDETPEIQSPIRSSGGEVLLLVVVVLDCKLLLSFAGHNWECSWISASFRRADERKKARMPLVIKKSNICLKIGSLYK